MKPTMAARSPCALDNSRESSCPQISASFRSASIFYQHEASDEVLSTSDKEMIRDPRGEISQKSFAKEGQGAGGNIGAANPSHFLKNNKTVRKTVAKILENFARFKSTLIVVKGKMLD